MQQSPYDTKNLDKLARIEGTRKHVHPFFYPPPAILPLLWVTPMSLASGAIAFLLFNVLCLFATLYVMHTWLLVSWGTLFSVSILLWPVIDSLKMGQINLFVGLLITLGIRYRSGMAIAMASMTKMAPALIFFGWLAQGRYSAAVRCAIGSVLLSLLATPWISISEQLYFYSVVLPEFLSGAYHGLKIPINIPANHSLPDLYNQLFPAEDVTILSDEAKVLSSVTSVSALCLLLYLSRVYTSIKSVVPMLLSLVCLMLIVPVYCYEHHLSLLLLPVTFCVSTVQVKWRKLSWLAWVVLGVGGMPLFVLRWVQRKVPMLEWCLQESKWAFIVVVMCCCIWSARHAHFNELESP